MRTQSAPRILIVINTGGGVSNTTCPVRKPGKTFLSAGGHGSALVITPTTGFWGEEELIHAQQRRRSPYQWHLNRPGVVTTNRASASTLADFVT